MKVSPLVENANVHVGKKHFDLSFWRYMSLHFLSKEEKKRPVRKIDRWIDVHLPHEAAFVRSIF